MRRSRAEIVREYGPFPEVEKVAGVTYDGRDVWFASVDKLNAVDPQAYLSDVITKIVTGHPNSRIDELLPWAYAVNRPMQQVA